MRPSQLAQIPGNHNNNTGNNLDGNLENPDYRFKRKRQHADNRARHQRQLILALLLLSCPFLSFAFLDFGLRFILAIPLAEFNVLVKARAFASTRPRAAHRRGEFLQTLARHGGRL